MFQTEVPDMSDKYVFLLELCVQMNRIKYKIQVVTKKQH